MESRCRHRLASALLTAAVLISCGGSGGRGGSGFPPVSNTNFEAQEPFSTTVAVGNHTQLNLQVKNGDITVTGMSGATSVVIAAMRRVQSESTQDAQAHLQDLKVNVQNLAPQVRVETIQPQDTGGRKYIVDYTITLPRYFTIHVNSLNGIVTLDSIDNDVGVNNLNGQVILKKITGSASIDLLTGAIECEVSLPLNGVIDLTTLSGDISLAIPTNTSAHFSAAVSMGGISVSNLVLQQEVKTSTSWSGTLGSGQGTIFLEAEQIGDISVSGV
jgi:DUF4097 and DUF4098 domain-containing protein YvlB